MLARNVSHVNLPKPENFRLFFIHLMKFTNSTGLVGTTLYVACTCVVANAWSPW